jgi:hypothetical protein
MRRLVRELERLFATETFPQERSPQGVIRSRSGRWPASWPHHAARIDVSYANAVSHSASVLIPLIAGLPKNVGDHSHRGLGIIVGASRRRCPHPIALAEQTSLQLV